MYSRENEKVILEKDVICTGGVENWLNTLLIVHQFSVGSVISQGLMTLASEDFDLITLIDTTILQVRYRVFSYLFFFENYIVFYR